MPILTEQTQQVAAAIDRVLEAEQSTAQAIAAAENAAQAAIENARERRRAILERGRRRVVLLHERAQGRLAARLVELDATASAGAAPDDELAGIASDAVARLAERLTGDTPA